MRQTLDDMLAVSRLSEQDVLIGIGVHCVRLVLPPLAALSVLAGAAALHYSYLADPSGFFHGGFAHIVTEGAVYTVGKALLVSLKVLLSGTLATLALTCMLVSLGLTPRSGFMPNIGAAAQIFMQLALVAGGAFLFVSGASDRMDELSGTMATGAGAVVLLFIGLLFYLARRLDWISTIIAYAFPLVLTGVCLPIYAHFVLDLEVIDLSELVFSNLLWALQSLSVLNVVEFIRAPFGNLLIEWWRYPLLLALQLGFVVMFAEFARDAIRRRKWGAAGV